MTLDLEQLTIFGLLLASIHWLVARAEITRWFWENAPRPLDALLRCPACSGFWLGAALSPVIHPITWERPWRAIVLNMLLGTFVTPVFEAIMLWGLARTAINEAPDEQEPDAQFERDTVSDRPPVNVDDVVTPTDHPAR